MSSYLYWDVNKYREEHDTQEQWDLRKAFMERWKGEYPEERLVCLAKVFANIQFMGCQYPLEVMREVSRLSGDIVNQYRQNKNGKLPQTVVSASDTTEDRVKGVKREGGVIFSETPQKTKKVEFTQLSYTVEDESKPANLLNNDDGYLLNDLYEVKHFVEESKDNLLHGQGIAATLFGVPTTSIGAVNQIKTERVDPSEEAEAQAANIFKLSPTPNSQTDVANTSAGCPPISATSDPMNDFYSSWQNVVRSDKPLERRSESSRYLESGTEINPEPGRFTPTSSPPVAPVVSNQEAAVKKKKKNKAKRKRDRLIREGLCEASSTPLGPNASAEEIGQRSAVNHPYSIQASSAPMVSNQGAAPEKIRKGKHACEKDRLTREGLCEASSIPMEPKALAEGIGQASAVHQHCNVKAISSPVVSNQETTSKKKKKNKAQRKRDRLIREGLSEAASTSTGPIALTVEIGQGNAVNQLCSTQASSAPMVSNQGAAPKKIRKGKHAREKDRLIREGLCEASSTPPGSAFDQPCSVQDSSSELCIAVTDMYTQRITRDLAKEILCDISQRILNEALDAAHGRSNGFRPSFRGKPVFADGRLLLQAMDAFTVDWVRKGISELATPSNVKLVVKQQSEVTGWIRCAMFVPDEFGFLKSTSDIGRMLDYQNRWAGVSRWLLPVAEKQEKGWFLHLAIPDDCLDAVLAKERCLCFGLGSVYLKFKGPGGQYYDTLPVSDRPAPSTCKVTDQSQLDA